MEKIDIPATAQIDGHRSILQQTAIEKAMVQRPHLVILGAGATIAAIPNGDKNGKKSSVMNDFATNLNLLELLKTITLDTESNNIEDIYSELFDRTDEDSIKVREQLESTIRNYFETLKIPDDPTIYDYLLLSLTKKDAIVSFNWDDLLIQAYQRVHKITKNLPYISFLHGNVGAGYCSKCGQLGARRNKCPECGKLFDASPLLYPVRKKDYGSNLFISSQWEGLKEYISRAAVITIFGYSAPKTDTEAIKILKIIF